MFLKNSYISSLKQKIISFKISSNPFKKTLYFIALFLWRLLSISYRFLFNPEYRSLIWLKHTKGQEAHQISNYTEYNRYPDLFYKCKELMSGKKELKILSYGCSTGEEVFTLREYFPDAYIVGLDINKKNIKKAISQNKDQRIVFSHEIEKALTEYDSFDIIFALAVFQRTKNRDEKTFDSSTIYPFEKFNTKITELNRYLKSNSLFVIDHSDYRFEDADIAVEYRAIKGDHNNIVQRNLYNRNNKKIPKFPTYYRIFSKLG